ncbi:MAG: hypothetical protein CMM31_05770, partial [Rhodospirillaceae bacterium]|nr:hypothetical protein [Rhodospirillaceae bacterium]
MSGLFHSLVALSYIVLGAVAAFGLPLLSAGIEPMMAVFIGGAVLVVGAIGHQALAQATRGRYIARELSLVSSTSEAMQRELQNARDELHDIKSKIGGGYEFSTPGAGDDDGTRSSNEVLGELRLLRTLFSQLTRKKDNKKSPAPAET